MLDKMSPEREMDQYTHTHTRARARARGGGTRGAFGSPSRTHPVGRVREPRLRMDKACPILLYNKRNKISPA